MIKLKKYFLIILTIIIMSACGSDSSSDVPLQTDKDTTSQKKGLGALIPTEEMLVEIPVAMPPVSSYASNELPSSYDLSDRMPPVRDQGGQGSCASWAVGYYLKSYHEHIDKDTDYGKGNDYSGAYSPAFLYNSVKVDSCDGGSYIKDNLERVKNKGISSWKDMPYNESKCDTTPSIKAETNAKCARILDYQRVRIHQPMESIEMQDIKYYLSHGNPLVIGIRVYNDFETPKKVKDEFFYKNYEEKGDGFGHAIVVVGYDDNKNAFKIINSWGTDWGNNGFLWIDYDVFSRIVFIVYRTEDALDECTEGSSYISIDKQSLVFNTKPINSSYKQSFVVSNSGSEAFDINDITVSDGYSVDWTNGTLQAGKNQTVTVTFSPIKNKSYNGKLTIEHNANKGKNSIELIGAGIDGENPNFPPVAKAGEDITIKAGESIKLNASKSSDSDGSIVNYEWKIGTTLLSNSKSFTKSDFEVGIHKITLKVVDNDGLIDTDMVTITVIKQDNNIPPIAKIEDYYISVKFGESVTLDGSKSSDDDGKIVNYEWKEGDKILSNSSRFSKKNFSEGRHTLTLTVTDDKGGTDKDIGIVLVAKEGNQLPIANAGENLTVTVGENIQVDASKSYDRDGTIVNYRWSYSYSYNYGNVTGSTRYSYSSSDPIGSITPKNLPIGKYLFTLTVTDNDGQENNDTTLVTVTSNNENLAPEVSIKTNSYDLLYFDSIGKTMTKRPNANIVFITNKSDTYDLDGDIVSYKWKDGNTIFSTESNFEKDDFSIGTHTITLFVTDNKGAISTDSVTVVIGKENNILPVAKIGSNQIIHVGEKIYFDCSKSSDADGNIIRSSIDYGDGSIGYFIYDGKNWTTYKKIGIYNVKLTVLDNDGGTDTDTMTVTVIE